MGSKKQIDLSTVQVFPSEKEKKDFMRNRLDRLKKYLQEFFNDRYGSQGPGCYEELKSKAKEQGVPYLSFAFLCKFFIDRFGDEGLDLLRNVMGKMVIEDSNEVIKALEIKERDAIAAARVLSYIHDCCGVQGEIIEAAPGRAIRIETFCPLKDDLNREWSEKVISLPMISLIAKCVNPNIVISHPKYLCGGDDRCEVIFELRG